MRPDRLAPGVRRLAIAVLRQAFEDATGTGMNAQRARHWLVTDSESLELWATCAGASRRQIAARLQGRPVCCVVPSDDEEAA